jgi:hypothetical protein
MPAITASSAFAKSAGAVPVDGDVVVDQVHQQRGGFVGYPPQRAKHGASTGGQKRDREAEDLVVVPAADVGGAGGQVDGVDLQRGQPGGVQLTVDAGRPCRLSVW